MEKILSFKLEYSYEFIYNNRQNLENKIQKIKLNQINKGKISKIKN